MQLAGAARTSAMMSPPSRSDSRSVGAQIDAPAGALGPESLVRTIGSGSAAADHLFRLGELRRDMLSKSMRCSTLARRESEPRFDVQALGLFLSRLALLAEERVGEALALLCSGLAARP